MIIVSLKMQRPNTGMENQPETPQQETVTHRTLKIVEQPNRKQKRR